MEQAPQEYIEAWAELQDKGYTEVVVEEQLVNGVVSRKIIQFTMEGRDYDSQYR